MVLGWKGIINIMAGDIANLQQGKPQVFTYKLDKLDLGDIILEQTNKPSKIDSKKTVFSFPNEIEELVFQNGIINESNVDKVEISRRKEIGGGAKRRRKSSRKSRKSRKNRRTRRR